MELRFGREIDDAPGPAEADLIVAADGINSRVRERYRGALPARASTCGPTSSPGWARPGRSTPSPSSSARPSTASSSPIATSTRRTARPGCWRPTRRPSPAGLDAHERGGERRLHGARLRRGARAATALITNRSLWRSFPMIRNARWTMDNVVLLGDAKATAHFSIGSGTKLAMEDAIALLRGVQRASRRRRRGAAPLRDAAAARRSRRPSTPPTSAWSGSSTSARFWACDPMQFAFGLMTRAKAITYDNLALRAPEFVEDVDRMFARRRCGRRAPMRRRRPVPPMFQPLPAARHGAPEPRRRLADVHVFGRWTACRATCTSCISARARMGGGGAAVHRDDLRRRPRRASRPAAPASGTTRRRRPGRASSTSSTPHSAAKICLQLGHAGRKGATQLMWEGMDRPLPSGRLGDRRPPRRCPTIPRARCRAR